MKAVITAILKDPEARAADSDPAAEEGHLREPILYFTGILRALQFTNIDPQGRYDVASNYTAPLGEVPYAAASVFNFFPPSYVIPGAAINAPEFAQENTAAATLRMTLADSIVRNHLTSFFIDMGATSFLGQIASATGNPATDSANLVTALNILFTHAQMAPTMQSAIAANAALCQISASAYAYPPGSSSVPTFTRLHSRGYEYGLQPAQFYSICLAGRGRQSCWAPSLWSVERVGTDGSRLRL